MLTGPRKRTASALRMRLAIALAAAASLAYARAGETAAPARHDNASYSFAVVSSVIESPADETSAQRMLEAITRERNLAFISQ